MAKPEIIGSVRSTYTRVVRMVCEEKGIDYVLTEAMLGAPESRAIHPFGKMPVLRHGEFMLCESKAIATYLDRSFAGPPVSLRSASRRADRAMGLARQHRDGRTLIRTYLLAYAFPKTADGKPDRMAIDAVTPAVRAQLAILDHAVAATGHLVGEHFTLADINLLPILFYVRQLPEAAEALAAATHLSAYYDRHAARPSFARTMPPAGPPRRTRASVSAGIDITISTANVRRQIGPTMAPDEAIMRSRRFARAEAALSALILASMGLSAGHAQGHVQGGAAAVWPTAQWQVSTPEEQGMDLAALARLSVSEQTAASTAC